jgi:hypothetical protein
VTHIYTFHDPAPDTQPSTDHAVRIVGIKDGIAWWALPVPFIWLVWHRLWRALAVYVVAVVAIGIIIEFLPLSVSADVLIGALFNVAVAVQGNDLRRAALMRRGFSEVAAVSASSMVEAECVFFDAWARGETILPPVEAEKPAVVLSSPEPAR